MRSRIATARALLNELRMRHLLRCAIALLLLSPLAASAYQLKMDSTGAAVRWAHAVEFVVDANAHERLGEAGAFVAIQASIDALNGAAPGLALTVRAGEVTGVGFNFDGGVNQNEIVVPDEWTYDARALAVTVVTLHTGRHEILDADIAFNRQHRKFKVLPATSQAGGEFDDIQNTLTHELGHAVGLAHNPEVPEAVMYPGARKGEVNKRTLSEDDQAGLLALYAHPATAAPSERGGTSADALGSEGALPTGCAAAPGAGGAGVLLILLSSIPLFGRGARRRSAGRSVSEDGAMRRSASAVIATTLLLASPAIAGDHVREPAEVDRAEWVATTRVVATRTLPPGPGQRMLRTELELQLRRCVKGACPEVVRVLVPGGRHGELEQIVDDHRVPEAGEIVALVQADTSIPTTRPTTRPALFRLETSRDFVAFARGLAGSGLELPR